MGGSSSSRSTPTPQYWNVGAPGAGRTTQQSNLGALNDWVYGPRTDIAGSTIPTFGTGAVNPWATSDGGIFGQLAQMFPSLFGSRSGVNPSVAPANTGAPKWMDYYNAAIKPYSGKLSAGLSPLEVESLGDISSFGLGDLQSNSASLLNDILTGKNRVGNLDAWQKRQNINLQDQITAANQEANLGGMLPSTGRIAMTNDLRRRALADLGVEAANIDEANAARQLQAVPLAGQVATAPLGVAERKLAAGAVPRQVEQTLIDAQKQEYFRQLTAIGIPFDLALKLAFYSPPVASSTKSSSDEGLLGGLNLGLTFT